MFRKIGFVNETTEILIIPSSNQPMAPINEQNVRAFRNEQNDRIYHVCLINATEISPETLRDQ